MRVNDGVNECGADDEIRCKEVKNQLKQATAQREIFAT